MSRSPSPYVAPFVGVAGAAASSKAPASKNARLALIVTGFLASLSAAPAAGVLVTVSDGTTTMTFYLPAAATTPLAVTFPAPFRPEINRDVTLSVAAPGGAVIATGSLFYDYVPA